MPESRQASRVQSKAGGLDHAYVRGAMYLSARASRAATSRDYTHLIRWAESACPALVFHPDAMSWLEDRQDQARPDGRRRIADKMLQQPRGPSYYSCVHSTPRKMLRWEGFSLFDLCGGIRRKDGRMMHMHRTARAVRMPEEPLHIKHRRQPAANQGAARKRWHVPYTR